MNTPQGTGAIVSAPDYRDAIASSGVLKAMWGAELPGSTDTKLAPVMMQAKEPACVSHSVAELMKLYWFRKTGTWVDFSPRFLDILAKRFDGFNRASDGTVPRLVFKLATEYGCATTATLPNDTSLPILSYRRDSLLTQRVFDEAAKYRIPGYVKIPTDPDITRQAIFTHGAISALFSIGEELWIPSWNPADTDPLRTPKKVVSGHQMTPKGWTNGRFNLVRNEWSDQWGNHGETEYDRYSWEPFIKEQWAITEIPSDIEAFLAILPTPSDFHHQWRNDLHYGNSGEDVKYAQIALMILGFFPHIQPQDLGTYGPKTASAVMAYQNSQGIPSFPNSIGPRTRGALNIEFAL